MRGTSSSILSVKNGGMTFIASMNLLFWVLLSIIWIQSPLVTSSASSLLKDPYWKSLLLNPLRTYKSTDDNLNNQSSIRKHFHSNELQTINTMVSNFLMYHDDKMWEPVNEVSIDKPFILFHQRKAGGSSLRDTLFDAAHRLKLPEYIPCKYRDCDIYTFPRDSLYAVYAGHYKWGAQSDLAKFNKTRRSQFSCATNYRHPISRIESCLYFRFEHTFQGKCLHDLDLETYHNLLLSVDEFGTSCLNEPFRILSGYTDEMIIDHLMDGVHSDSERRVHNRRLLDYSALNVFNLTLQHTLRCTPLLLEFPESYDLMSSRIPSLGNMGGFKSTVWIQVGSKTKKVCGHLQGEQLALTESYAALEVMLYDAVLRKVLRRIADIDPSFLFHMKCRDASPSRDYIPLEETKGTPMALVAANGVQVVQIRTLIEYALGYYTGTIRARREYMGMFPAEQFCGKRMVAISAEVSVFKVRGDPMNNYNAVLDYFLSASKKRCHHGMIPNFQRASILTEDPFFKLWQVLSRLNTTSESMYIHALGLLELKKLKRIPADMLSVKEKRRRLSTMPMDSGGGGHVHNQHGHGHHANNNLRGNHHASQATATGTVSIVPAASVPLAPPLSQANVDSILDSMNAPSASQTTTAASTSTAAQTQEQPPTKAQVESVLASLNSVLPPPKLQAREEEDEEKMSQQQQLQQGQRPDDLDSANATSNSTTSGHMDKITTEKVLITGSMLEYEFYHNYFDLFFDWYTFSWLFNDHIYLYRSYVNTTRAALEGLDKVEFQTVNDLLTSEFGKQLPKYDPANYLFISYDSILEGAVEISTDTKVHSTFVDNGMTLKYNGTFAYTPQNNALMRLLQETGYADKVKISAVQCAFSHVQSASDQWMTSEKIKNLKAMRSFYSKYPSVLQAVQKLIKKRLNMILLAPEQMRFLYPLI